MKYCPCGSSEAFDKCCGPLIDGVAQAKTAEALMRSRYSAYAVGNIDYVSETHAPEAQTDFDRAGSEEMARTVKWKGLKIEATEAGGEGDDTGSVTFTARYVVNGQEQAHREVSSFRKVDGLWRYVDGDVNQTHQPRQVVKIGRNDPCTCGSGKKYKKCCGA